MSFQTLLSAVCIYCSKYFENFGFNFILYVSILNKAMSPPTPFYLLSVSVVPNTLEKLPFKLLNYCLFCGISP